MGIANSIGMIGMLLGGFCFDYVKKEMGGEISTCMSLILTGYIGVVLYSFLKKRAKNRTQLSKALIWVLKDRHSWYFGFIAIGFYMATFVFATTWSSSFLMEVYGLSKERIEGISSLVFLGLGVGGPCIGYLSDRFSQRKAFVIILNAIALSSVGAVLYCSPMPIFLLGALFFITGVCSSGYLLLYTLAIDYNHPRVKGVTVTFISALLFLGSLAIESQLEFPILFFLLTVTGFLALLLKDSPPEMEHSKKMLERLLVRSERISNS